MYLSFFNLKEKPFRISPDPKFLWLGETHKEALAMMKYGIEDNRGFLLLSGDIGTGKTTLVNGLLQSLDDSTLVATIPDPGLEKLDFYNFLMRSFHIDKAFKTKGDFLVYFIHFLHKANSEGKKVLIIIDEAQRLSHEMLEEIRQLSNIEKKDTKLLNIFLVGQHELIDTLNETRNRALLQRITMKYLIGPLKESDVEDYILFRLKIAGTENKIFSSGAIRQIISFSNCYPRLINIICDHSLLSAYVKGKKKVDAAIVKECAGDLQIKVETPAAEKTGPHFFRRFIDAIKHPIRSPILAFFSYAVLISSFLGITVFLYSQTGFDYKMLSSLFNRATTQKEITPTERTRPPDNKSGSSAPNADADQIPHTKTPVREDSKQESIVPAPATVSLVKPPLPQEKIFTIRFPLDSNEFSQEAYALLDRIVDIIHQHQGVAVHITGYTDSLGGFSYNKRLSEFRATVIQTYLVGQGINPKQITVSGLGPAKPVASNDTPEGRSQNRRVEIVLRQGQTE